MEGRKRGRFRHSLFDVKVGFVSIRDLEYGLSRLFEMSSKATTPIRVFRAMDETEKWMME